MKLTFYGGAKSVTGANYLLEYSGGRIVVDCGMFQGLDFVGNANYEPFPYDPATVDYLFITHGHIDHIGRIPKFVADGFTGRIVVTEPTLELAQLSLRDSVRIIAEEAHRYGREPFFTMQDVEAADQYFDAHTYGDVIELAGGGCVTIFSAGHVLGSAMYRFELDGQVITFTGDVGNAPAPLIGPPDVIGTTDYLVIESAYGDRKHPPMNLGAKLLAEVVKETIARGGTLLIPSFALERTQIVLFHLNNMVEKGVIPMTPVYVDSPLAIKITEVYRKFARYFKPDVQSQIAAGDRIFEFPMLRFSKTVDDSKKINKTKGAKIIIAGNGMSTAGRIMFHEMVYLSDPKNTILLVGYQVEHSLGRQILDKKDFVRIFGKRIELKADVHQISSFSAHADNPQLIALVEKNITNKPKRIFVVQGE
ncbi:MAG: MBL fold metallo-hydrolase, partial [Parcubacteria group bacterium]|nr:MBL fold metallo-hydrolase [Parcubacteria group bacterium]